MIFSYPSVCYDKVGELLAIIHSFYDMHDNQVLSVRYIDTE